MFSYAYIQGMRKLAYDRYTQYAIQRGDTFDRIGKAHGVSAQRMTEANPGVDPDKLQLGQKINIPVSDRQHIINTRGFDPEGVQPFDSRSYWRNLYWESHIGRWKRPLGAPAGNTARGYHMMNKPTWDDMVRRHPQTFAGRRHEELDTDFDLSHQAYATQVQDKVRDWQYANGKQVPATDYPRFWYMPGNPYGKEANAYLAKVNGVNLQDVARRIKEAGGRILQYAQGE